MPEPPKPDLKKILQQERIKDKLSPVDRDFYMRAQELIRELENDLSRAERENTRESTKYLMVESELSAAKKNYSAIIEMRMAKINYEASVRKSLKRQENSDPDNLTPEERVLYEGLYAMMGDWRRARLNLHDPGKEKVPVHEKKPSVKRDVININDYIVVRVLINIPTFAGVDGKNYTLLAQDVVTVPAVNARALIKRGAAMQIPK